MKWGGRVNIGIVDVDATKFPNIALMKISAWHKARGDNVSIATIDDIRMGNLFASYDKFYVACVFDWNLPKLEAIKYFPNVEIGGVAVSKDIELPPEIEHIYPDYDLYGIKDTAYGFLSRGCPRHCPFCVVADKEGTTSRKVADLSEWWNGQKYIYVCDPNILACVEHLDLLEQLANSKAQVNINQGLDVRLLTRENIELLNSINMKELFFAWDNPRTDLRKQFEMYSEFGSIKNDRNKRVFVLTNYWSTHEEDLARIYWLRDNGYVPYVTCYDKPHAPKITRKLMRWCNNRFLFYSCDKFEDFYKEA